jgi:uncharacterized membrane protein YgdD (TMEM256/DUF423 family)
LHHFRKWDGQEVWSMWSRVALVVGSCFGLTSVVLGAMGAHMLKRHLSASLLASFQVGVRYQMIHALVLLLLGVLCLSRDSAWLRRAIVLVIVGVLGFSGSIYALVWLKSAGMLPALRKILGPVTPLGGVMMIAGWGCLLVFSLTFTHEASSRVGDESTSASS